MKQAILIVVFLSAALVIICAPGSAQPAKYLSYQKYKALLSLSAELKGARLSGLEPAAESLWANGQLRMPEQTHIFEADFNGDGRIESAMAIKTGKESFVLIAEKLKNGKWKRNGLVKTSGQIKSWNGRALVIEDDEFVAWGQTGYHKQKGALAKYCYAYDTGDFSGVILKLTYVGVQTKPFPGLLVSTFYRLPNQEAFRTLRSKGVNYGNDDIATRWHLSTAPKMVQALVKSLSTARFLPAAEDRTADGEADFSLAVFDSTSGARLNFYEVLLSAAECQQLINLWATKIAAQNKEGSALLKEYTALIGR